MTDEINFGSFDCPDVKCGFIGEIGCCYPLYGKFQNIWKFSETQQFHRIKSRNTISKSQQTLFVKLKIINNDD